MKILIRKNHTMEFILFLLLIIVMIFSSDRYGTIFAHVFGILILFIFVLIIRGNTFNKAAPFLLYGCLWCFVFIIGYLLAKDRNYIGGIDDIFYISIMILFTCLFMGINFTRKRIDIIFNVYTLCNVLVSLIILFNYLTGKYYMDQRASFFLNGVYKDPNYVASLIVPAIFWLFLKTISDQRWILKIGKFIFLVIMFLSLLATGSRAALVGILVSISIALILELMNKNTKLIYKVLTIIFIIVATILGSYILMILQNGRFTDISGYMNNIRLVIWSDAIDFWTNSPLVGNGINATSNYTLTCWYRYATHNCFLDALGDSGILGIICFLGILRNLIKKANNKHLTLVFACICLVPQMFINGFYTFNFWFILCLIKLISNYKVAFFNRVLSNRGSISE